MKVKLRYKRVDFTKQGANHCWRPITLNIAVFMMLVKQCLSNIGAIVSRVKILVKAFQISGLICKLAVEYVIAYTKCQAWRNFLQRQQPLLEGVS
jgi:hypothetical protein